jgi:amidophosphoribosyltransferase
MSTYSVLFAPQYMGGKPPEEWKVTREIENRMAADLGADTLRYLSTEGAARAINLPPDQLCRACVTGQYPTLWGKQLAQEALEEYQNASK